MSVKDEGTGRVIPFDFLNEGTLVSVTLNGLIATSLYYNVISRMGILYKDWNLASEDLSCQ